MASTPSSPLSASVTTPAITTPTHHAPDPATAPSRRETTLLRRSGNQPASRAPSDDLAIRPRSPIQMSALTRTGTTAPTDATAGASATADPKLDIHLARTLPEFQRRLDAQKARPVDLEAAAAVINAVRHNPFAGGPAPKDHGELAKRVTPAVIGQWNAALGLTPEKAAEMERIAAKGGRWIPTSGSVFQAALYGAIPVAALHTSPVNVLYASLAALVVQPFATAALQTPIVSAITLMRQKSAPMVKMPGNIKARETLPEIEKQIKALEADAVRDAQAMRTLMDRITARHRAAGAPDDEEVTPEAIDNFLATLEDGEREELETLQQQQTERAMAVGTLVMDAFRLEGMQDRQFNSTTAQAPWRTLRAISGIFAPAMQAGGVSAGWITATSVTLAFGALAGQHWAAGLDEKKAQADEHTLGLLYGDLLTPQGQADWNAGRPVGADGVDETKFRNLLAEPETTIAGRVATHLAAHVDELQARLDAMPEHAESENDAESGRPELETLRETIAECQADVDRLRNGDVTNLSEGGHARMLLEQVMKDTSVAFAWREGKTKLTSPLEYSAQLGQRFAAQFAFLGLGGAGAVGLVRGVGAAVGGLSKLSAGAQVAVTLGAGVLGTFSALSQYTAVNVKNARRDRDGEDAGFLAQLGKGIVSPAWQRHATHAGHEATKAGGNALDADRASNALVPSPDTLRPTS